MTEETSGSDNGMSCNRPILDSYNSDLHLKIDPDGYACETVNSPSGFQYLWAGARATHGIKTGKVCFEVRIVRHLAVDFGTDPNLKHPHLVRVGWSVDSHSVQLGKDPLSYGYGGTGNISFDGDFKNYGQQFTEGDVITALINFNTNPTSISYCKNGTWLGRAASVPRLGDDQALFPHVLLKNCRININYGQEKRPWFDPPPGYIFIDDVPVTERVRGMDAPQKKADCEIIMIVGLPGSGKTKWALKMQDENIEKRYTILGTDKLIDMMKVVGLPRKDFQRRWDALSREANGCLNVLLDIASKKNRNYILDQTNVYSNARNRKMNNFQGFKRICAVMQPQDLELKRRMEARTRETGKVVPVASVLQMKANYTLPQDSDPYLDEIIWVELGPTDCQDLADQYRKEGLRAYGGFTEHQSHSPAKVQGQPAQESLHTTMTVGSREKAPSVKDHPATCYQNYLLGLKKEAATDSRPILDRDQSANHNLSGISGESRSEIGRQDFGVSLANDRHLRPLSGWGDASRGDYNHTSLSYIELLKGVCETKGTKGQFLNPSRGSQ